MAQNDVLNETAPPEGIWMRGLWMLVLAIFFGVAEFVLGVATLVQFLWMLFAKERNRGIATFGESLGRWLKKTADFQTGATDEKPFPWTAWGK